MNYNFQELFTPVFIITAIFLFIAGVVGLQLLDRLFAGSKNLNAIRMFAIAITINIVILIFIIMSFSKVKFAVGFEGPQGNKGERGIDGAPGGLTVCKPKAKTAQEQKALIKAQNYLDLKPPFLEDV
jgi:hypothetical protein